MKDLYELESKIFDGGEVVAELLALHILSNHNAPQDVEFVVKLERQGTQVKEWGFWSLSDARDIYEALVLTISCFEEEKE